MASLGGLLGPAQTTASGIDMPLAKQREKNNKDMKFDSSQRYAQRYTGKYAIVTGGTGAIGQKVVRKLIKGGITRVVVF